MNKIQQKLKKQKDGESQTIAKSRLRFLAFDKGRLVVVKALRDRIDGDKMTQLRHFPDFKRAASAQGY